MKGGCHCACELQTRHRSDLLRQEEGGGCNVKARLELHYGNAQGFTLNEYPDGEVQAILCAPEVLSASNRHQRGLRQWQ